MRAWRWSLLVIALMGMASPAALAVTVLPGEGVSFAQVDFFVAGGAYPDSRTGKVEVDVAALQAATGVASGYLNVLTDLGWVVENLPVLPGFTYPSISTHFYLAETSGLVDSLVTLVDFAPDPVVSFTGTAETTYSVGDIVHAVGGYLESGGAGEPDPPTPGVVTFEEGGLITYCCQPGHVVVETADCQCAPEAVASSFDWLRTTHGIPIPDPHVMGLDGDGSLVGALEDSMGRWYADRRNGDGVDGE